MKTFHIDAVEEALKQFHALAESAKESQPDYDEIVTYVRSVQARVDGIARNFLLTHWENTKRTVRRLSVGLLFALAVSSSAHAQTKRHWYRDVKGFWLTLGVNAVASSFDVEATQRCIHNVIGCSEGNAIMGNGRAREYSFTIAADVAIAAMTHRLRNDDNHKWWMPQIAPISTHTVLAIRSLKAHNVCDAAGCTGVE